MGNRLGVLVTARIINHIAEGFQASVGVSRGSLQTEHPPGEVLTSFRRQREGHDRPIMVDPPSTRLDGTIAQVVFLPMCSASASTPFRTS